MSDLIYPNLAALINFALTTAATAACTEVTPETQVCARRQLQGYLSWGAIGFIAASFMANYIKRPKLKLKST